MAKLLRSKDHEKNVSYEEGYKKGMEEAIRQGYAHYVQSTQPTLDDVLSMLHIVHNENCAILTLLGLTNGIDCDSTIEKYVEMVREVRSYGFDKK